MNYTEFASRIRQKYPGSYDDLDDRSLASQIVKKYPAEYSDITFDSLQTPLREFGNNLANSQGVLGTANTLLKAPEKMSRQGLQMIANSIPESIGPMTGNRMMDIARGAPKIAADTLAQVAPGFVSKGAILMSGALQGLKTASPLIKMMGKGIGGQLESMSGAAPGMTQAAAEAPILNPIQIQPGRKAASEIYQAGKSLSGEVAPELTKIPGKLEFVQAAVEKADAGKLNPAEALEARKELDLLRKRVTGEFFRTTREKLDAIAKPIFSEADTAYKQGILAASSRQLMPQNKMGGASAFKTGIITGLQALKKTGGIGKVLGTAGQLAISPAAVGAGATIAGDVAAAAKPFVNNPVATGQGLQLIKRIGEGSLPSPVIKVPEMFQLKPDIVALQQGRKIESKSLPNPAIPAKSLTLTVEKAKEFLKQAKGNREKARKIAQDKGYVIPEVQ